MNPSPKKIKSNHPWRKWNLKSTFIKNERCKTDMKSIFVKESQRGFLHNSLTSGFRARVLMDNKTLSEL